jgi:hypothetical protein
MNSELIADICNKLQASLTALELLSESKEAPKEFIEVAKRGFNEAECLLLNKVRCEKINCYNIDMYSFSF